MASYVVSDTSLTAVADAIREKTGKSAQMAFPNEFVSEVEGIESGYSLDDLLSGIEPSGVVNINTASNIGNWSFKNRQGITRVNVNSAMILVGGMFNGCNNLEVLFAPYAYTSGNTYTAQNCAKLHTIVIGNLNNNNYAVASVNQNVLKTIDLVSTTQMSGSSFNWNRALNKIILRSNLVVTIGSSPFSNTPFASGGTGGTIYIPKVLYDELGTGSANDYKSATNWSTIDAYGTITWAQIEGSQYENYYADGTPIPQGGE